MQSSERRDFIKKAFSLSLLGLTTGCFGYEEDSDLKWTSINVCSRYRQGDSHLISKNGKHYLMDGGHPEVTASHFLPFLKKNKISHLDAVMINHPHSDHYGGIKALFENSIKVDKLYMNMPTLQQMEREWWGGKYEDLQEIQRLAQKANTPIYPIKKGDIFRFDQDSFLEVLYIYDGIHTPIGVTDINDMSAIVMIKDGKNRFLLTGDLNLGLGTYLAKNADDIKADIVKIPHHGATQLAPDSFFKKASPKDIIVTAPEELWRSSRDDRIRRLAISEKYGTYVNGLHGDITVISDGTSYTIKTEKSPKDIFRAVKTPIKKV